MRYLDECISDLRNSHYVDMRASEVFCRAIVDLLLLDRLRILKDENATRRLKLVPEVPLLVKREGIHVSGRADWCLGHGNMKSEFESALVVLYVFVLFNSNISTNLFYKGSEKMGRRAIRPSSTYHIPRRDSGFKERESQDKFISIRFVNRCR